MALLARHDRDSRAPGKPVALHVPSDVREHLVASRGQAHRVGPLGAGHEPERHVTWEPQKLNEPGPGDLLDEGGRRRRQVVVGRLVPAHGEHVGCGRGVEGAPDDEAEIARTGRRDHGRLDRGDELVDDLARRGGAIRQPAPDRRPHGVQVDVREHRGLRGGLAVGRHVVSGSGEQRAQIGHDPHLRPHQAIPPASSAVRCAQHRPGTRGDCAPPRTAHAPDPGLSWPAFAREHLGVQRLEGLRPDAADPMRTATGHQVPVPCVVPGLAVRPARPGPGQPERYADPGKPARRGDLRHPPRAAAPPRCYRTPGLVRLWSLAMQRRSAPLGRL